MAEVADATMESASASRPGSGISARTNAKASTMATMLGVSSTSAAFRAI